MNSMNVFSNTDIYTRIIICVGSIVLQQDTIYLQSLCNMPTQL